MGSSGLFEFVWDHSGSPGVVGFIGFRVSSLGRTFGSPGFTPACLGVVGFIQVRLGSLSPS